MLLELPMMQKEEYRQYFLKWKRYVRYAPIVEEVGLQKSNFSQFLSGSNLNAISAEKLEIIKQRMEHVFQDLTNEEDTDDDKNV